MLFIADVLFFRVTPNACQLFALPKRLGQLTRMTSIERTFPNTARNRLEPY
jgi:hypothetical protein